MKATSSTSASEARPPAARAAEAVVFLAGLLAGFAALNVYYQRRAVPRYDPGHVGDPERVRTLGGSDAGSKPEVVFLGDSRVIHDLDDGALGPGDVKLAHRMEDMAQIYLKAKYLLRTQPRLRAIVVPLDDYALAPPEANIYPEAWEFADWRDLREVYQGDWGQMVLSYLMYRAPLLNDRSRRVLIYALHEDAVALLGPRVPGGDEERRRDLKKRWRAIRGEETMSRHLRDSAIDAGFVRLLTSLVQQCAARGVGVIGIRYPIMPEFRTEAAGWKGAPAARRIVDGLPLKALLDYERLYDSRPDCFMDQIHLDPSACARDFTARVRVDVAAALGPPVPAPKGS
jgi:hypothetical protein